MSKKEHTHEQSLIKQIFFDKSGKLVLGQFPNAPLWIAVIFWSLRFVPLQSAGSQGLWISQGGVWSALLIWAYLELVQGVNVWRRVLGVMVGGWVFWQILIVF